MLSRALCAKCDLFVPADAGWLLDLACPQDVHSQSDNILREFGTIARGV